MHMTPNADEFAHSTYVDDAGFYDLFFLRFYNNLLAALQYSGA
jgi:hypothetical protein